MARFHIRPHPVQVTLRNGGRRDHRINCNHSYHPQEFMPESMGHRMADAGHPRYEESPSPWQTKTTGRKAPTVIFMSQTRFGQDENHGVLEPSHRRLGPRRAEPLLPQQMLFGTPPLLLRILRNRHRNGSGSSDSEFYTK